MLVLATVLSKEWTAAEVKEPREIWNTSSIAVNPHWVTAETLRTYCQRRLEAADGTFEVNLFRELREVGEGRCEARFGAAVVALGGLGLEDGGQWLRVELARLAKLIKEPVLESTVDMCEVSIPSEAVAAALRQELVQDLRSKHGGMKLKQSLEICSDEDHMIRLAGTLLERPDEPAEEIAARVRGTPDVICFSKSWVKLESGAQVQRRKLFISDSQLMEQIVTAGMNHEVVTLGVRVLNPGSTSTIEVTSCTVEARNADPLTNSERLTEG